MIRTLIACMATAVLTLSAGLLVGQRIGTHTTLFAESPPQGRWSPCFGAPEDSGIVNAYAKWAVLMEADGAPVDAIPSMTTIPEGRAKGTWILPGCVAIEDRMGTVTFWDDAYHSEARWVPHPDAPRDEVH